MNRSTSPIANKDLLAGLLFFVNGEGNKPTSPSFAICNVAIEACSTSLEVLNASLWPTDGIVKDAAFPIAIRLLIDIKSFFACANGKQVMLPSCMLIGAYNALL